MKVATVFTAFKQLTVLHQHVVSSIWIRIVIHEVRGADPLRSAMDKASEYQWPGENFVGVMPATTQGMNKAIRRMSPAPLKRGKRRKVRT